MRIIGGRFKGRRINPPAKKWPTRPTTDFAREALFNILENRLNWSEITMLDAFGGTGLIGIEAISRGCSKVTYVDKYGPCIRFVNTLLKELSIQDQIVTVRKDVFSFLKSGSAAQYDFIFMDPPYDLPQLKDLPRLVFQFSLLFDGGLLVIEHGPQTKFEEADNFVESRSYGSSVFSFFT